MKVFGALAALSLVGCASAATMNLTLLTEAALKDGAVCLDGSPAGYYFRPAATPDAKNDWMIWFQGGGWCYDEIDCTNRALTALGSSTTWENTRGTNSGLMNTDCTKNPDFCNMNFAFLPYCDGNSFSGNRDEPYVAGGKKIYMRGHRVLKAVLDSLRDTHGLSNAENVLLSGCSAGGLSTFLHTDYVGDYIKSISSGLKRYKAAPVSGFFLDHKDIYGTASPYTQQITYAFGMSNATSGVNQACIKANPGQESKCNMAQYVYPHIAHDIFPINSAVDAWQTGCVYGAKPVPLFPNQTGSENGVCNAYPDYRDCLQNIAQKCNNTETALVNQYGLDFMADIQATSKYTAAGGGGFFHSCHTHCEASGIDFFNFAINGVTIQQGVSKWWNANNEPASAHTYTPCQLKAGSDVPDRRCNPTCNLGAPYNNFYPTMGL